MGAEDWHDVLNVNLTGVFFSRSTAAGDDRGRWT